MELIKNAVRLTEAPAPASVADVIKALNTELKGKSITAFGKNDKGLWGENDEPQTYTITKVSSTYHDKDDIENGGDIFTSIDFQLGGYSAKKDGLIYTGKNFIRNLKQLIKATSVGKMIVHLDYSEQGMQGEKYVNCDADIRLPKVAK